MTSSTTPLYQNQNTYSNSQLIERLLAAEKRIEAVQQRAARTEQRAAGTEQFAYAMNQEAAKAYAAIEARYQD